MICHLIEVNVESSLIGFRSQLGFQFRVSSRVRVRSIQVSVILGFPILGVGSGHFFRLGQFFQVQQLCYLDSCRSVNNSMIRMNSRI